MATEQHTPADRADSSHHRRRMQALQTATGIMGKKITTIRKNGILDFVQSIVSSRKEANEPFYVLDLGLLLDLMENWTRVLPNVRPYYAVKCNPDRAFLGAMAALGSGFDCASRVEIDSVLALGVSPDRIIFANPCKLESHIEYAASVGVYLTTFDSKSEVEKIQRNHPKSSLLIRIKVDDSESRFPLSSKYGAHQNEIVPLLKAAHAAQLIVSGVSFHVGSGGRDPQAYRTAIAAAKQVFDAAEELGMPRMNILNIGGGFTSGPLFHDMADAVKEGLESYFSNEQWLTIMAEPGRLFAEKVFTLASNIIGKRVRGERKEYWITEGLYGSMNHIINTNLTVTCIPLSSKSNPNDPTCRDAKKYETTVFGPTCDARDTVLMGEWLPELEVGDWLVFPSMGAYTSAVRTNFNGFIASATPTILAYSDPS